MHKHHILPFKTNKKKHKMERTKEENKEKQTEENNI